MGIAKDDHERVWGASTDVSVQISEVRLDPRKRRVLCSHGVGTRDGQEAVPHNSDKVIPTNGNGDKICVLAEWCELIPPNIWNLGTGAAHVVEGICCAWHCLVDHVWVAGIAPCTVVGAI